MAAGRTLCMLVVLSCGYHAGALKLNVTTNPTYPCGATVSMTCHVEAAEDSLALPNPLNWKQDTVLKTNCFDSVNSDCIPLSVGNIMFSSDIIKKEYYVKLTKASLSNAGIWSCAATSYTDASSTLSFRALPDGTSTLTEPSKDGTLKLETNCLASSSLDVEWFYKDSSGTDKQLESLNKDYGTFVASVQCTPSAADCIGNTYQKYSRHANFAYDAECSLEVRAKLTTTEKFDWPNLDPAYTQYLRACIKVPDPCLCFYGVAVALINVYVLLLIIIGVIWLCIRYKICVPLRPVMIVMIIALFLILIWAAILLPHVIKCRDQCKSSIDNRSLILVIITLALSGTFALLIISWSCTEYGKQLWKLFTKDPKEEEVKEAANTLFWLMLVHPLIPLIIGILILVFGLQNGWFKRPNSPQPEPKEKPKVGSKC